LPDSGAEARVKRPDLLQASGLGGAAGEPGLLLDARRAAALTP